MKTKIEIDIPDGYEFVRFGHVNGNDRFINSVGEVERWKPHWLQSTGSCVIVRKKEPRTWWIGGGVILTEDPLNSSYTEVREVLK